MEEQANLIRTTQAQRDKAMEGFSKYGSCTNRCTSDRNGTTATTGSRELSDAVLLAHGWERKKDIEFEDGWTGRWDWLSPSGQFYLDRPDPTRSVDDALALAGDDWTAVLIGAMDRLDIIAFTTDEQPDLKLLPLAICAALVEMKDG